MRTSSGLARVTEKVALEGLQQLVAHERLDLLGASVLLQDVDVVLERAVRDLERVLQLVTLEHIVVALRLVARPVLRITARPTAQTAPCLRSIQITTRSSTPASS